MAEHDKCEGASDDRGSGTDHRRETSRDERGRLTNRDDIEEFNARPSTSLQEKLTLYLCGLGHLAREIMAETSATDFTISTKLEPKNCGMTVDVEVTVEKSDI